MARYKVGDVVRITNSLGLRENWVDLEGTVVRVGDIDNSMPGSIEIEPHADRPDRNHKARFWWPTEGLVLVVREYDKPTKQEIEATMESIRSALHD